MRDHHISTFFETLFWTGALLILVSFFYPRWFVITITVGIMLMIMATVREGFKLRRAKTLVGIVKKNEPKIIHRFVIIISVIIVFIYLLFKQTLVYNLLTQLYDLTQSIGITWWIFVLIGIVIGLFILFCAIKIVGIEYERIFTWMRLKQPKPKKQKEKKIEIKKKKDIIVKKIIPVVEDKPSYFAKLL